MSDPVKKGNCREVHLFVTNGTRLRTDLSEATRFLLGKLTIGCVLGFAVFLTSFKNLKFDAEATLVFRFSYWLMCASLCVVLWWLIMAVLSVTFWRKWPDRALPSLAISTVVSFSIVWIAITFLILYDVVPDYSVISYIEFVRSWIFVVGFEFCLVVFVWPAYQANYKSAINSGKQQSHKQSNPEQPTTASPPELKPIENYVVQIGDITVDTRMLLSIQAQEHYVELRCINRSGITRLSISKAVKAVEAVDGMQVHRSWWVARRAAKQLKREDGKLVLELNSGETISVSRGRSSAVRAWMKTIPHDAGAVAKKDPV
ncbi:LytTR family DNA-binding domain-containing protein [Halocynthiibacter sp.]|uniref:LytTR family DNA-binding domain-containing protein n=1 Tax=Halocynthiibacter sp. TaxID=1979210 RepID=UPI003C5390E6